MWHAVLTCCVMAPVPRYEEMYEPGVAQQLFAELFKGRLAEQQVAQLAEEFAASKIPRKSQVRGRLREGAAAW